MQFHRLYPTLVLIVSLLLALQGCKDTSSALTSVRKPLSSAAVDGFQIPVFPTPDEQLDYTQSWFASQDERRAALLAVGRLFPKAVKQRGAAALDLSYLKLGQDYRLAETPACIEALHSYQETIEEFRDLPEICAKAYWYMGWISCDLLHNRKNGLAMYRIVVSRYPEVTLDRIPPTAPWITIFPAADRTGPAERPAVQQLWADLALVEIIRHAETADQARQALTHLRRPSSPSFGLALKIGLQRPDLRSEILPLAREFLQQEPADRFLSEDLRRTIADETLQHPEE